MVDLRHIKSNKHKHNLSIAGMGHKVSDETRQKISEALKGRSKPTVSIDLKKYFSSQKIYLKLYNGLRSL